MTIRERIADWLTGGALTRARGDVDYVLDRLSQEKAKARRAEDGCAILEYDNRNGWANSDRFSEALRTIAACETPKANATVKRMARIARQTLEGRG